MACYNIIWYTMSVALSDLRCIFPVGPSSSLLFSNVAYLFDFSVKFSLLSYFAPNWFCFFVLRLLHSPLTCWQIFSVVLLYPVLSVLFDPFPIFFSLPSFAGIFWFIPSRVLFVQLMLPFFLFVPTYSSVLLQIIFAFCHRFLICVFSRISHPGSVFLFVVLVEHRFFTY